MGYGRSIDASLITGTLATARLAPGRVLALSDLFDNSDYAGDGWTLNGASSGTVSETTSLVFSNDNLQFSQVNRDISVGEYDIIAYLSLPADNDCYLEVKLNTPSGSTYGAQLADSGGTRALYIQSAGANGASLDPGQDACWVRLLHIGDYCAVGYSTEAYSTTPPDARDASLWTWITAQIDTAAQLAGAVRNLKLQGGNSGGAGGIVLCEMKGFWMYE